ATTAAAVAVASSAVAAVTASAVLWTLSLPRERLAAAARRTALARLPGRARIALLAGERSLARALLLALRRRSGLARGCRPLRRLAVATARAIPCAGSVATAGTVACAGPIAAAGTVARTCACTRAVAGAACLGQPAAARAIPLATLLVKAACNVLRRAL